MVNAKTIGMSAAAAVFHASLLSAGAGPVAWYHFDDIEEGARLDAGEILNAVDGDVLKGVPHRVHYGSLVSNRVKYKHWPVATNAVPDTVYVYDPLTGTAFRNEKSFFFTHSNYKNGSTWQPGRQGGLIKVASDKSLSLDDLTVEFFVLPVYQHDGQLGAMQLCAKQSTSTTKFTWSVMMNTDGKPYVTMHDSSGGDMGGAEVFSAETSILDGKWHHLAFTVENGESGSGTAKLYVDGVLEKTLTLSGPLCHVDDGPLFIAASELGYSVSGGFIDEVRISSRALSPLEFLRYWNIAGDPTRLYAGFDSGVDAYVPRSWPQDTLPGTSGKRSSGQNPRMAVGTCPGARIGDGAGNVLKDGNTTSVEFSGSTIVYPNDPALEMTEQTVEMFVKMGSSDDYMALAQMVQSDDEPIFTKYIVWKLWVMSNGDVSVTLKTDAMEENTFRDFDVNINDGKWHHIAVTFAETATGTKIRMYRNGRQSGSDWDVEGKLDYSNGSRLSLGTYAGAGRFYGWIDEFRISAGVLPVDDFLRIRRPGLAIKIR